MAYSEDLAQRVRVALAEQPVVDEKKMFGGLAFMVNNHMCCGILGSELMVRVGPERYAEALAQPHARIMDFNHRVSRGMVMVDAAGLASDATLNEWVARGLAFVQGLPPK